MARYFIISLAIVGYCAITHAEVIKGPAEVRGTPSGEPILVLRDSVRLEAAPRIGDWYKVQLPQIWGFDTFDEAASKKKELAKGDSVMAPSGGQIGTVLRDFKLRDLYYTESRTTGKHVWNGSIVGYVHCDNIRQDSIVEFALEEIINGRQGPLRSQDLESHIRAFQYRVFEIRGDSRDYVLYEHTIGDPSPGPRVLLLFEGAVLVGMLHSRDFANAQVHERKEAPKGYRLTYIEEADQETQDRLEEHYFALLRSAD